MKSWWILSFENGNISPLYLLKSLKKMSNPVLMSTHGIQTMVSKSTPPLPYTPPKKILLKEMADSSYGVGNEQGETKISCNKNQMVNEG